MLNNVDKEVLAELAKGPNDYYGLCKALGAFRLPEMSPERTHYTSAIAVSLAHLRVREKRVKRSNEGDYTLLEEGEHDDETLPA